MANMNASNEPTLVEVECPDPPVTTINRMANRAAEAHPANQKKNRLIRSAICAIQAG